MTDKFDDLLLRHDAAPSSVIDKTAGVRAQARLEQIVATDPLSVRVGTIGTPRRGFAWRLALVPALVAVLVAVAVVVWPHSPAMPTAFANWIAVPQSLSAVEADRAVSICKETVMDSPGVSWELGGTALVSEQRGDWALLYFREPNSNPLFERTESTALCFLQLSETDSPFIAIDGSRFTGVSWFMLRHPDPSVWTPSRSAGNFDAELTPTQFQPLSLREVELPEGAYSWVMGRVGSDVAAITIHTDSGQEVEATVGDGVFLAWWPGGWNIPRVVGPPPPNFCEVDLNGMRAITATLRDGSVVENNFPAPNPETCPW